MPRGTVRMMVNGWTYELRMAASSMNVRMVAMVKASDVAARASWFSSTSPANSMR